MHSANEMGQIMKLEDYQIQIPSKISDAESFDKEKWKENTPIDFFKMAAILNQVDSTLPIDEAFTTAFYEMYKVTRLYIPDILYKFVSLSDEENSNEKRFCTLENNKLFLSEVSSFNDPFDCRAYYYDPSQLMKYDWLSEFNGRLFDNLSSCLCVASLTQNDPSSLPMWAHYASNHRGYCVSYKIAESTDLSSLLFPVQYTDKRIDITRFVDRRAQLLTNLNKKSTHTERTNSRVRSIALPMVYLMMTLSSIKHVSWSYEREFRCLASTQSPGMPYINAKAAAIYIGLNCKKENVKRLYQIGGKLGVPVYQMRFDELSPDYQLSNALLRTTMN